MESLGINFTAAFQHSFNYKSIVQLKDDLVRGNKFPKTTHCIKTVNDQNPHLIREWSITRDRVIESRNVGQFDPVLIGEEEYIQLDGPGGFTFIFNKSICEFNPCFRWISFLSNSDFQLELRYICKEIADYFASNSSVYMGDNYGALDYVFEGQDMDYYLSSLREKFGESKSSLDELIDSSVTNKWILDGYYIDYFIDLTN